MTSPWIPELIAADFVDGFQAMQSLAADVHAGEVDGFRYLEFPEGRRGSRFTHEFFPVDCQTDCVLAAIESTNPGGQNLVSLLSADGDVSIPDYLAAGYDHWGNETLMVCDLSGQLEPPASGIDLRPVADTAEAEALVSGQRVAGFRPHPITERHLAARNLIQRWVAVDDHPAAFGRIVLCGEMAYLADVVTLPEFRRRGFGEAIVRGLLVEAQACGATRSVLTSSEMAERLYRSIGFQEIIRLTGFESRESH